MLTFSAVRQVDKAIGRVVMVIKLVTSTPAPQALWCAAAVPKCGTFESYTEQGVIPAVATVSAHIV
jgi:hypothetical protein